MYLNKLKSTSDADYQAYSNYIAKLASVATQGDPPPTPFHVWFFWRHGAFPTDTLVGQHAAQKATPSLGVPATATGRTLRQQRDPSGHTLADSGTSGTTSH
jgi:hypothetical protein